VSLETRMAWRNVWRNPRRTTLTVAATVFAIYLVVVFVAMAAGTHEKMIEDSVRIHTGHITLASEGYFEAQTLEHYTRLDSRAVSLLDELPELVGWAPRVTSFALVSLDAASQGVVLLGVDPAREGSVSTLPTRIDRGRFVAPSGRDIVLGRRLARSLGADLGDELLLFGAAYSLESAYELFTLVGTIALPEPELERSLAIISLADAQEFFVYGDRVSEIALLAENADAAPALEAALRDALPALSSDPAAPALSLETWDERMPELVQLLFLDDAGMYMLLVVLVVVVGFGILNTILMAILERQRELGVMLALGLPPRSVFRVVYLESLFLAAVGLVIGLALALPTVVYLEAHPIFLTGEMGEMTALFGFEPVMTWRLKPLNPLGSAFTILVVALIAAFYPAYKASRGRPVDALRSL